MKNKSPMLLLTFLGIIFILPTVLAWIVYHEHGGIFHKTSNYGELIIPPRDLGKLTLYTPDGKIFSQEVLRKKWLMLYVNPGLCSNNCEKELYNMRQIRLATGKESERVQRAIVTMQGHADDQLTKLIETNYQGTFQLQTSIKELQQWLAGLSAAPLAIKEGYLYLVDPLGNVMMEYPVSADPSGIYKDLKKLLKVSQIG